MIIDHVSLFLYGGNVWLFCFARWGFPCFAYGVAMGATHTSNPRRYLLRMLLLGSVAQIPFAFIALDPWQLNIVFTLLLGALALLAIKYLNKTLALVVVPLLVAAGGLWSDPAVSYGAYGVGLVVAFGLGRRSALAYLVATSSVFLFMKDAQMFAIFAWPLIYTMELPKVRFPSWLYYLSYPGHLVVIAIISRSTY